MKNAYKGLKSNNVEEVQWWLGDLFITLCENKEIIDKSIYTEIVNFKNDVMSSVSSILFHTRFKGKKTLEENLVNLIKLVDARIVDIRLFLEVIS